MYDNCGSEYYNLFMNQFIQTLAQLSAVLVTSTLAVPAYSYYTRGTFLNQRLNLKNLSQTN